MQNKCLHSAIIQRICLKQIVGIANRFPRLVETEHNVLASESQNLPSCMHVATDAALSVHHRHQASLGFLTALALICWFVHNHLAWLRALLLSFVPILLSASAPRSSHAALTIQMPSLIHALAKRANILASHKNPEMTSKAA